MGDMIVVDKEGKIAIPSRLRDELNLDYIEIEIDKSRRHLVLKPIEDKMERLIGSLSCKKSFSELRKKVERLALDEVRVKWES